MTTIAREEYLPLYFGRIGSIAYHTMTPDAWYAPSDLVKRIEPFRDLIGSFEELEPFNTHLPSLARTMPANDAKRYRSHLKYKTVQGLMSMSGMSGPLGGWAKVTLASCPDCLKHDVAPCGSSFQRREHLVPGVLFCSRHHRALQTACGICANAKAKVRRRGKAGHHCGCGLRTIHGAAGLSSAQESMEIELARISALWLDPTYLPNLDHARISEVVLRGAHDKGLLVDGRPQWRQVNEFFSDHPLRPLLQRTGVHIHNYKNGDAYLSGKQVFRHPLSSIAFLYALHDDWTTVEAVVGKMTGQRELLPMASRKSGPQRVNERQYRRAWVQKNRSKWFSIYADSYADLQKTHPDFSHMQLMRMLPSNAKRFLTMKSLTAAGLDVPFFEDSIKDYKKLDASFRIHVLKNAKRLVREGYPHRITQPSLTKGHDSARSWNRLNQYLPRTRAALAKHIETDAAWRRRLGRSPNVARASKSNRRTSSQ
ncbi:hypothetical protein ACW9YQ_14460 (plasmid) [Paraburkholderia strydomiana]